MLNPFDPPSRQAMLSMRIAPRPEEFAARPPSAEEGEALLGRLAAAPDALRAAAEGIDDAEAAAVLQSARFWEAWLDFALGQLAVGGRLKLGGNVLTPAPGDASPAGLVADFAGSRAKHVAGLRGRGPGLWDQAATGMDGLPIAAYPLLSAVAANDAERIALLREGR